MVARVAREDFETLVMPRRSLALSATLTCVAILLPVGVALFWLCWPSGRWPAIVALAGAAVVLGLVAYRRYRISFAGVTADDFVKRGWLPGFVRVRRDRIAEVVMVSTYRPHSTDVVLQLVAFDAVGVKLFRMRGHYRPDEAMTAVGDALGAAPAAPKPIALGDFYRRYPHARYWYEGRPHLTAPALIGLFALATGALVLVYRALGG